MRRLIIAIALVLFVLAALAAYVFLTGLIVVVVENKGTTRIATALVLRDRKIEPTKRLAPGETAVFFFVPRFETDVKLGCTNGHAATMMVEGYVSTMFVDLIKLEINGCQGIVSRTKYLESP